jgi:hypothetical protein
MAIIFVCLGLAILLLLVGLYVYNNINCWRMHREWRRKI